MSKTVVTLTDYPRVIEPTVSVIEAACEGGAGKTMRLHRLPPVAVNREIAFSMEGATHFFGDSDELSKSRYILVYDACGLLIGSLYRTGESWAMADWFHCDVNGAPNTLPSLRLVFKDERARDTMLYYLDGVVSGKFSNTTLRMAMDGLAEKVRIIDVMPVGESLRV